MEQISPESIKSHNLAEGSSDSKQCSEPLEKLKYIKEISETSSQANETLPDNQKAITEEQACGKNEKSLWEMGFRGNHVDGWENIVQPPKKNLQQLMGDMINKGIKPSVQIQIGKLAFKCHMMVLQCYSKYFMQFSNETLVQLPEEKVTPAAFMTAYNWMISAQPLIPQEGIFELLNAAIFLRIDGLINQICACLHNTRFTVAAGDYIFPNYFAKDGEKDW